MGVEQRRAQWQWQKRDLLLLDATMGIWSAGARGDGGFFGDAWSVRWPTVPGEVACATMPPRHRHARARELAGALSYCHTQFWESRNEASIRVPRIFKSHVQ
jgi:hypothetical protein